MIEQIRQETIKDCLAVKSVGNSIELWNRKILEITHGETSGRNFFELGNHLRKIFRASAKVGQVRSNAVVSAGGTAWEGLVNFYLNLCLVGTPVVVFSSKKAFVPQFFSDAISVKYNNFKSNTEADLVWFAFPNLTNWQSRQTNENISSYLDRMTQSHLSMSDIACGIIQTKTNWNDNAQIPMLWDMVYSARGFGRNVRVGTRGRSISSFKSFSYSFVTVPTQKDLDKSFKVKSTCVNRVRYLSGGNYWGEETKDGVADSLCEFFGRNLADYLPEIGLAANLDKQLENFDKNFRYFGLWESTPPYFLAQKPLNDF